MDTRRAFLATLGAGWLGTTLANGQTPAPQQGSAFLRDRSRTTQPPPPVRKIKTTALFKSPEGYPNGIAVAPEGLWICEQKSDNAVLVDWKGKLLKTLKSQSKNTSGIAYGDGCVWMAGNSAAAGRRVPDRYERSRAHASADSAWTSRQRRRVSRDRVRGRQDLHRRAPPPRHSSRGREDVAAGIHDPVRSAAGPRHRAQPGGRLGLDGDGNSGWPGRAGPVPATRRVACCRQRPSPRPTAILTDSHGTTARCTAATPASIRAGRTTSARRTATSSRSTSSSSFGAYADVQLSALSLQLSARSCSRRELKAESRELMADSFMEFTPDSSEFRAKRAAASPATPPSAMPRRD